MDLDLDTVADVAATLDPLLSHVFAEHLCFHVLHGLRCPIAGALVPSHVGGSAGSTHTPCSHGEAAVTPPNPCVAYPQLGDIPESFAKALPLPRQGVGVAPLHKRIAAVAAALAPVVGFPSSIGSTGVAPKSAGGGTSESEAAAATKAGVMAFARTACSFLEAAEEMVGTAAVPTADVADAGAAGSGAGRVGVGWGGARSAGAGGLAASVQPATGRAAPTLLLWLL